MMEGGYALYDKRTGKHLDLVCKEIETNIEMAVKVIVTLKSYVPHLVGQLDWDAEIERRSQELPELSEPPEIL